MFYHKVTPIMLGSFVSGWNMVCSAVEGLVPGFGRLYINLENDITIMCRYYGIILVSSSWNFCWSVDFITVRSHEHKDISNYWLLDPLFSRCQAIIWTNAGILVIRTLGTNFSEILSKIHTFSFKKMHLKMSSAKWWLFCLSLNMLRVNSLGPSNAIWRQISGSTLAQVMACCLTAPNHYLTNVDLSSVRLSDIHLRAISQEIPQPSITEIICKIKYCETSNIRCTLVGNKIVDHSDAVGASPVGAAPTTSSFST